MTLLEALHLTTAKAKALFADLLLAVAADKDGAADVLSGRADGLEPPIDNRRRCITLQHYTRAMELGTIENEDEETIGIMGGDPHHHADILRSGDGDARREGQRYRSFWSEKHGD